MAWPPAARDHGTFCVSCHTAMPYALARPTLRPAPDQGTLSINERKLIDNVTKRVRQTGALGRLRRQPNLARSAGQVNMGIVAHPTRAHSRRFDDFADSRSTFLAFSIPATFVRPSN